MFSKNWQIPKDVNIAMTNRHGGVSQPPFDSLNLGLHVGDNPTDVQVNRQCLMTELALPNEPQWLEQIHSNHVINLDKETARVADGSFSKQKGQVAVVMTADCLPVLLCDTKGTQVAALHAGWRGLCDGILEAGIAQFSTGSTLIAYLGPAIGAQAFEVGAEVKQQFVNVSAQSASCFKSKGSKYLADLNQLATLRLNAAGVNIIYKAEQCTYTDLNYFSYRRDGKTGRMASLIWLT